MEFSLGGRAIPSNRICSFAALMIAGLIFLRDIAGLGVNSWAITIVSFGAFLLLSSENVICLTMFIIPFISGISAGKVMLLAAIFIIIKCRRIKISVIFMIFLVTLLELNASRWYLDSNHSEMFPYITCSAVLFILILNDFEVDYRRCIKYYFFGIIAAICIALLGSVLSGGLTVATLVSSRGHLGTNLVSVDGARLSFNANTYAFYCISGITCGFVLIKNTMNITTRRWFSILTLFLLFAGVFSVSRTFLLVAALCVFLYVSSESDSITRIIKIGLLIIAVVIAGLYVMQSNSGIINAWLYRFTGEDIETGGQRLTLFQEYMDVFFSNERFKWIGTGVTQYREITHVYNSMHNSLQQILICLGIPGACIYVLSLLSPVWRLRYEKIKLLYWIPFIGIVLFLQSIQFLNPCMFIPTYAAGIYALRMGRDKNYEE